MKKKKQITKNEFLLFPTLGQKSARVWRDEPAVKKKYICIPMSLASTPFYNPSSAKRTSVRLMDKRS